MNGNPTSGEWVAALSAGNLNEIWRKPGNAVIARCPQVGGSLAQAAANARLMAQAKAMLALLERAVADRIDDAWLKEARGVIGEARGGDA